MLGCSSLRLKHHRDKYGFKRRAKGRGGVGPISLAPSKIIAKQTSATGARHGDFQAGPASSKRGIVRFVCTKMKEWVLHGRRGGRLLLRAPPDLNEQGGAFMPFIYATHLFSFPFIAPLPSPAEQNGGEGVAEVVSPPISIDLNVLHEAAADR